MKFLLLLLLIVSTIGCSSLIDAGLNFPVEPGKAFKLEQATMYAPNEKAWRVQEHKIHSLILYRNIANGTAILNAVNYKVGEFKSSKKLLKHVIKERVTQDDKTRFKMLKVKNKLLTFKGLSCFTYETLAEDHKDKGIKSKSIEYFKTKGYICRYPLEYLAFQMEVSHRSKKKEMPKALLKAADEFFSKTKFVDATIKRLKKIP